MRIVQLSDTHIIENCDVTIPNTERIVEFINDELRPDLVVHTGDVVGLDPDHADDRSAAAQALSRIEAPLLVVPGNHDVGDPADDPWMGLGVTSARVAEHNRVFGVVPAVLDFGDWSVVGVNSQLFGSGLPEEEEQWDWLEREFAGPRTSPVLMFLHVPVWPPMLSGMKDLVVGLEIPWSSRKRLLTMPGADRLCAVGTGHLHWYRRRRHGAVLEVTAPAVAVSEEPRDDGVGLPQQGVVEWELGHGAIRTWFRAPTSLNESGEIPAMAARSEELVQRRASAQEQQ